MTRALTLPEHDESYRVAPDVPLVVLYDVAAGIAPWYIARPSRLAAQAALPAIDRLVEAARSPDRRDLAAQIPSAVTALGGLATTLARYEPLTLARDVPSGRTIHCYFGVRHSDTMASGSAAFYLVNIFRWCIEDLTYAALEANQTVGVLRAVQQVIADLGYAPGWYEPGPEVATLDPEVMALLDYLPPPDVWVRWVIAHHAYLAANLLAADHVRRATHNLRNRRRYGTAVEYMDRAAVQVRGLTGWMLHSAVLPNPIYPETVRPTMAPGHPRTNLPRPLTGNAFSEHHAYRRRLAELLTMLVEPYATLVRHQRVVAEARARLLRIDVADLVAHAAMGELLVGGEHSLVQADHDPHNALSELLAMLDHRRAEYAPFLPERVIRGMITTLVGPMSIETANTIATYAGYLTVLCVLPLCWQTWRGKAHPAAVTWGIWTPIGFVATIGMALGGAPFASWFLKAMLSSGPLLVFIVAAWRGGRWRTDRFDRVVITIGVVGTILYVLVYVGAIGPADPVTAGVIAVLTAMVVDAVGAWPTWRRAWRNPYGELRLTYGLAMIAVTAVLITLPLPWTFLSAGLLCFLWLQMLSIILVLTAGRVRLHREQAGHSGSEVGHPGVA